MKRSCLLRALYSGLLSAALALGYSVAQADGAAAIAAFSAAPLGSQLPMGWQRYQLGGAQRLTDYTLEQSGGAVVLKAVADASASAVIHPLRADPQRTPWLEWRWRVDNVVAKGDIRKKSGDDYPARVYVLFDYDASRLPLGQRAKIAAARLIYGDKLPTAALCYVWDNRQPVGFSAWNAYTSQVRMIVVESGASRVGEWVSERHNVAADFRAAFGEAAPPISALILAADTDNTAERTVSYFGDFSLRADAE